MTTSILAFANRDTKFVHERFPEKWSPPFKNCTQDCWKDEEVFRPVEDLNPADRARLWELIRQRQGTCERLQFNSRAQAEIDAHGKIPGTLATTEAAANLLYKDTELGMGEKILEFGLGVEDSHCDNANHRDSLDLAPTDNTSDTDEKLESEATVPLHKTAKLPGVSPSGVETAAGTISDERRTRIIVPQEEPLSTTQPSVAEPGTQSCTAPRDPRKQAGNDSECNPSLA